MTLHRITFTGVDDRTDLDAVRAICATDPRVEFAVLWSDSRAGKQQRYPSAPLQIAKQLPSHQRAVHLCGAVAGRFCAGPPFDTDERFLDLACFEGRVQVNREAYSCEQLLSLGYTAKALRIEVVIQSRSAVIPWVPGLTVLSDCSGGTGRSPLAWPFAEWVYTESDVASYAGGLSPDNIGTELPLIQVARGSGLFAIDMESGVRTDDWLDLDKVEAVRQAVREWESASAQAGRAVA